MQRDRIADLMAPRSDHRKRAWLAREHAQRLSGALLPDDLDYPAAAMPAGWTFDELPPSGARRGDDPAQHAFRPDLATFVREVIQNANDQALAAPTVSFTAGVLQGSALSRFRRAIAWDKLAAHLRATDGTRTGARIGRMLAEIQSGQRLPVLCVEDRNTVGLTGNEDDPHSHFRALCKDTLFSHKREASAGGSYGLGKSVLWAFSGLRTVLFVSRLADDPAHHRSPRLIGRAELPSHSIGAVSYVGSGWFGQTTTLADGRTRAESLWNSAASSLIEDLQIPRSTASGTSILVVGVRDPTQDDDDDTLGGPQQLLHRIGGHAATEFWPAMLRAESPLAVLVDGHAVDPRRDPIAAPFCACLDDLATATDTPRNDGDITRRTLQFEIPRRRDEARSVVAEVELVVRLAEAADRPGVGRIAAFRGPGMIVRHWDATRLASTMRPFHAFLRCGRARGASDGDIALERFLRAAEPPGHDDWTATVTMKDEYVRGARAALTELHNRVLATLRGLLTPTVQPSLTGPDRLRRRLAVSPKPARSSAGTAAVSFGALSAELREGHWWFEGEIRPRTRTLLWSTELAVRQVGEDGSFGDDLPIANLDLDDGEATSTLARGRARIDATRPGTVVGFRGATVALRGEHAWTGEVALELVTVGTREAEVQA